MSSAAVALHTHEGPDRYTHIWAAGSDVFLGPVRLRAKSDPDSILNSPGKRASPEGGGHASPLEAALGWVLAEGRADADPSTCASSVGLDTEM